MNTYYHNSLGANPKDGFMYYTERTTINRLDAKCNSTPLCDLGFLSVSGTFDSRGNYWVVNDESNQLYCYDISTCQFKKGPFILPERVADIAFNVYDCHLYLSGAAGALYKVDSMGQTATLSYYGAGNKGLGLAGGLVFGSDNVLYAMQASTDPSDPSSDTRSAFFYRITNKEYEPSILIAWTDHTGPTGKDSRLDMASFPCIAPTIDPIIDADKTQGCLPLRVKFSAKASSIPTPNKWAWDFDDGGPILDTSQEISHVFWKPGVYKIKLKAQLRSNCGPTYSDTTSITVTVEDQPTVFLYSPHNSVCEGTEIELQAFGTGPFTWSTNEQGPSIKVRPTSTSTYTVTSTTGNANCVASDTLTLVTYPKPDISMNIMDFYMCAESPPPPLHASGANYFIWSDGFVGAKRGVTVTQTTKYQVTGYNSPECFDTTSVTVTYIPKPPILDMYDGKTYCPGETLRLETKGWLSTQWRLKYGEDRYGPELLWYPLENYYSGPLYVTVSDYDCAFRDTLEVNIRDPAPIGLPTAIGVCMGEDLTIVPTRFTTDLIWKGPNGFSSDSNQVHLYNVTSANAGKYSVKSHNRCADSNSVAVGVHDLPDSTIYATATDFCTATGIQLDAKEGYKYSWKGPDGFVSNSSRINRTPADSAMSGKYELTVADIYGCKNQNDIQVNVKTSPTVQIISEKVMGFCEGQSFELEAQVLPANAVFEWMGPHSFNSTNFTVQIAEATQNDEGNYVISSSLNGCVSKDSIQVIVDGRPDSLVEVLHNKDTICELGQGTVELHYSSSKAHQITWYNAATSLPVGNYDQLELNKPEQTGSYYAIVQSEHSLCPEQKSNILQVKIYQAPKAIFSAETLTFNYVPNSKVQIPLIGVEAGTDSVTFLEWQPSTWLKNADTLFATIIPQPQQKQIDYTLRLKTGKPGSECIAEYIFPFLTIYPVGIPNAFSPNNDDRNDTWLIEGLEWYPSLRLYIYNRWGNKVFESTDGYKDPWNGQLNGKDLATGTYYYLLELRGSQDHSDHTVSGSITLVR